MACIRTPGKKPVRAILVAILHSDRELLWRAYTNVREYEIIERVERESSGLWVFSPADAFHGIQESEFRLVALYDPDNPWHYGPIDPNAIYRAEERIRSDDAARLHSGPVLRALPQGPSSDEGKEP